MWGDVARCRRGRPREGAHLSAHTIARPRQLAPATQALLTPVLLRAPRRLRLWRGSPPLRSAGARRREQVRAQLRRRLHRGEVWGDMGRYGQLRRRLHAASPRAALAGVTPEGGGGGGGAHEVARLGRYRGDAGEMQGRCRGDIGEVQGRHRGEQGLAVRLRIDHDVCQVLGAPDDLVRV